MKLFICLILLLPGLALAEGSKDFKFDLNNYEALGYLFNENLNDRSFRTSNNKKESVDFAQCKKIEALSEKEAKVRLSNVVSAFADHWSNDIQSEDYWPTGRYTLKDFSNEIESIVKEIYKNNDQIFYCYIFFLDQLAQ